MKMPKNRYGAIKEAITVIVQDIGWEACKAYEDSTNSKRLRWGLYWKASHQLSYNDDHPGFKSGHWKRLYPCYPGFQDGGADLLDSHIDTALRKIMKEITNV